MHVDLPEVQQISKKQDLFLVLGARRNSCRTLVTAEPGSVSAFEWDQFPPAKTGPDMPASGSIFKYSCALLVHHGQLLFHRFHPHFADSATVHFHHRQPAAFIDHTLAAFRNVPQPHQQEAGKCFHSSFAR